MKEKPAAGDEPRLDEGPRPVADRRHRLLGLGELFDEADRTLIGPQLVGVDGAAGNDEGVVVVGGHVRHSLVSLVHNVLVDVVVHRLDVSGFGSEMVNVPTLLRQGLQG